MEYIISYNPIMQELIEVAKNVDLKNRMGSLIRECLITSKKCELLEKKFSFLNEKGMRFFVQHDNLAGYNPDKLYVAQVNFNEWGLEEGLAWLSDEENSVEGICNVGNESPITELSFNDTMEKLVETTEQETRYVVRVFFIYKDKEYNLTKGDCIKTPKEIKEEILMQELSPIKGATFYVTNNQNEVSCVSFCKAIENIADFKNLRNVFCNFHNEEIIIIGD